MSDYPLPSGATSIWTAGDQIMLAFPPTEPNGRGHTVSLPASVPGLTRLLGILRERERAQRRTVGTKAAPVQYDLDSMAREMAKSLERKKITQAERNGAAAFLEELGL